MRYLICGLLVSTLLGCIPIGAKGTTYAGTAVAVGHRAPAILPAPLDNVPIAR